MKAYVKPTLQLYSLNANDALCVSSGCSVRLSTDIPLSESILISAFRPDLAGDGIQKSDFETIFGYDEGCANATDMMCKFTSVGEGRPMWS